MNELSEKLVLWIRDQVKRANCNGVVLGLSGGVDSSVTAVLCQHAFPDNVLALLMPCYTINTDTEDALIIAHKFKIPTMTINLNETFDTLLKSFPQSQTKHATQKISEANIKPRLRMTTLYYFANRFRYLVVGTCNRSEIAVGYSTKYGDSACDIIPLGNLLKYEVRDLARHLGIPDRIINKPPTAGLWEGQTDEGEMGITYDELDQYLQSGQAREEIRQKIDALNIASSHKRMLPPTPPF